MLSTLAIGARSSSHKEILENSGCQIAYSIDLEIVRRSLRTSERARGRDSFVVCYKPCQFLTRPFRRYIRSHYAVAGWTKKKRMLTRNQLLVEIEQKAAITQQQMLLVKAQIAAKKRENRMLQLTSNEINNLADKTPVYEGVGKM